MKSILLTTTALVAFAGIAAADGHTAVSHGFSATAGYNDSNDDSVFLAPGDDNEDGFYWEGNMTTTASAELDNGWAAGAYVEITVAEDDGVAANDGGIDLTSSDFAVSLTSDMVGVHVGDVETASKHWSAVGDMESDGFTTDHDSAAIRADVMAAGVEGSVSYLAVDDQPAGADAVDQLSVGVSGAFGAVSVAAVYQEEADVLALVDLNDDFNASEIYGLSGSGTFGGATVSLGYAENTTADTTSIGVSASYPVGPVTATAYYVMEDAAVDVDDNYGVNVAYADGPISVSADYQDDQGLAKWALEGAYDIGGGISAFAGVLNENEQDADYYAGASYAFGAGATASLVYALDEDGSQEDEIGGGDYQEGVTAELSLAF